MQWVPLVASLVAAAAITPTTVRVLGTRPNYRGAQVAHPLGIVLPLAAFAALAVAAPLYQFVDEDVFQYGVVGLAYVVGVAFLGLLDDLIGSESDQPRGWRGHFESIRAGRPSTGVAKAVGSFGLAAALMANPGGDVGTYLLEVAVLVFATNLFNLLDLRPGRAEKALFLLGIGLAIGELDFFWFWGLSIWFGPILVLFWLDLKEVGMLGDTGANVIGAVAGLWLVDALSNTGLAIALAVLALITIYGEFRSISAFVERTPGLRQLDLLGRSHV